MRSRPGRDMNRLLRLALAGILFLSFNILINKLFVGARIDLTEDELFTLSDGSSEILSALDEPISIRLYFSRQLAAPYPGLFRYGGRVADLLREFERAADGMIDLKIIDPEPFTDEEDEAQGYGLQGVASSSGESIYLGLVVTDTTDRQTVLPFLAQEREPFLEYDLIKTIFALSIETKPKLGLLTGLPMQYGPGGIMALVQGQARPYVIYQQLEDFFEIVQLEGALDPMPDDLAALLIVHPPQLDDRELYAIDQFVLAGGRALVFVDPYSEEVILTNAQTAAQGRSGGFAQPPIPDGSSFDRLFEAWGIEVVPDMVVADLELAQQVDMGGGGPRSVREYIVWLGLQEASMNADDIVSGAASFINMASVGAIKQIEGATTEVTPLLRSSQVSSLIPVSQVRDNPDPDDLIRDMTPDEERYVLVARVSGPANSAFPDGPPIFGDPDETEAPDDSARPHLAKSDGDINILVGADVDMFADRFWVQVQNIFGQTVATPIADNGALILGAVDHMVGSDALISLRSRGVSNRPFVAVDKIRRAAEARFLDEEKALRQSVTETEARLLELEAGNDEGGEFLSAEQDAEIERFRAELSQTRQQLRAVQRNLRRDIDALGGWLAAINIIGIPILLILLATLRWFRARRRKAA